MNWNMNIGPKEIRRSKLELDKYKNICFALADMVWVADYFNLTATLLNIDIQTNQLIYYGKTVNKGVDGVAIKNDGGTIILCIYNNGNGLLLIPSEMHKITLMLLDTALLTAMSDMFKDILEVENK